MPSVGGNLVLIVNHVYLVVRVVHENILCIMFFDALRGAFLVSSLRSLRAAMTVRDVPGHRIGGESESSHRQHKRSQRYKFQFHILPLFIPFTPDRDRHQCGTLCDVESIAWVGALGMETFKQKK